MQGLHSQIVLIRRLQWALAGTVVLALVAFYLLGYRPLTSRLRGVETRMRLKHQELQRNQAKARGLPDLTRQVDRLQLMVERSGRKLPRQPDLGLFMKDLTQIGQQAALRNFTVQPMASKRLELFFEQPISLNFESDFINAAMFLRQIEDLQRLTRIRRLGVRTRDDKPNQVEVDLTMNIYFSEM